MTPIEIHICIAEIAKDALEIKRIMKADKLSYNKRIDTLSDDIIQLTCDLHQEFFPDFDDDNNE